jgi:hypothetical protein
VANGGVAAAGMRGAPGVGMYGEGSEGKAWMSMSMLVLVLVLLMTSRCIQGRGSASLVDGSEGLETADADKDEGTGTGTAETAEDKNVYMHSSSSDMVVRQQAEAAKRPVAAALQGMYLVPRAFPLYKDPQSANNFFIQNMR